jgi:hypothetical protein
MQNLTSIFIIFFSLHSSGQQITVVDNKHFKIDSTEFSIAKINYVKKIEVPFVHGGDGKFARKSQISFKLRDSSSINVSFGDSLYIQWILDSRQTEPEYYRFSDYVIKSGEQTIYTYAHARDPKNEKYSCIVDFVVMDGKKYFVLVDTDKKDFREALDLILDLQELIH